MRPSFLRNQRARRCRQLGQATLLYKDDADDRFPFGLNVTNATAGALANSTAWPAQLLPYLSASVSQPSRTYWCPSDPDTATPVFGYRVNYLANRHIFRDVGFVVPYALRGAQVSQAHRYLMFGEKDTASAQFTAGATHYNAHGTAWNTPGANPSRGNSPGMVRHHWGMTATAADGHVEWLRMPPYAPGATVPPDMFSLADTTDEPANSLWPANSQARLFLRSIQGGGGF